MAGLASVIGLIGTVVSAVGTIAAGEAQKDAKDFEAQQQEIQGQEERAASQRDALRKRKERDFLISRQQAVAASSGLGALDETVQDLAGDVVEESAYQEGMIRYGGEERARGRRAQAAASRYEGEAARTGAMFSAAGTIMGGIGSFAKSMSSRSSPTARGNYRYG